MKIPFACPSCGASGSVDESFVGRPVRCKQCTYQFAIPRPGEADDGGYALSDPPRVAAGVASVGPGPGPVFVASRGDEPPVFFSPRKPRNLRSGSTARRGEPRPVGKRWPIVAGVLAATALVTTALIAPNGVILAGAAMIVLGAAMVLVGWAAGAYGAFSEDFLYGFFYVIFPIYTAYYLVTRWEDLRAWFMCSTAGFGLVFVGTRILDWSGVVG